MLLPFLFFFFFPHPNSLSGSQFMTYVQIIDYLESLVLFFFFFLLMLQLLESINNFLIFFQARSPWEQS